MIGEQLFINIMLKLLGNEQVKKELIAITGNVGKLTQAVDKNTASTKKNSEEEKRAAEALKKKSKVVKELPKQWTTVNMVMGKNNKILREMQVRYKAVDGVMTKQTRTTIGAAAAGKIQHTNLNTLLSSFTKLRWALVNVSLVIMTLKTAYNTLLKPLVDLETQMKVVQKRTKLDETSIKELRTEFINLTRTIPESAQELAKIGGIAGQLGIKGTQNISEFVRVTALMGQVTVMSSEEAALALAKLSQAYELPIRNIENLASVINELSNNTAANSKEIAEAMLKMGPAATALGITADAAAAISATLIDMGMKASRAGTRMKGVFNKLASQTSEIAKLYEEKFGQDITDSINENANEALLAFVRTIASADTGTQALTQSTSILGKIGGSAVTALAGNYLDLVENMVLASEEFRNAKSLQAEFGIQTETTAAQLELFANAYGASYKEFALSLDIPITGFIKNINEAKKANKELLNMYMLGKKELGSKDTDAGIYPETLGIVHQKLPFGIDYKVAKASSFSEFDFKDKVAKMMGYDSYSDLSEGEMFQLDVRWEIENKNWEEVRKLITERKFKLLDEINSKKYPKISDEEEKEYIERLKQAYIVMGEAPTSGLRLDAFKALNEIKQELISTDREQVATINELSKAQAEDSFLLAHTTLETLAMKDAVTEYNEEMEAQHDLYRMGKVSKEQEIQNLKDLETEYSAYIHTMSDGTQVILDVPQYIDRMAESYDNLGDSIDEAAEAQKAASYVYSYVNKQYSEQIKSLQELYNQYSKAKFKGEQDELDRIHDLEVAIKKEKLEQLKLGEAVEETNDAYKDNEFEAWVTTIENFISAALKEGDLLGKNVSAAIGGFQAKLLSTSKFDEDSGSEAELTALEELEREREIAQLEYELGMGEQHYQLQQYIDELEHEKDVVFDNAQDAFSAMEMKKQKMDEIMAKQDKLTKKWEYEQHVIQMTTIGSIDALGNEEDAVDDLIDKYIRLAKKKAAAGSGGGGSSSVSVNPATGGYYSDANQGTSTSSNTYGTMTSTGWKPNSNVSSAKTFFGPGFADGGLITKPTVAMIGEAGPEMVVPLTGPNAGRGLSSINISSINISGVEGDASSFAAAFSRQLRRELRTL